MCSAIPGRLRAVRRSLAPIRKAKASIINADGYADLLIGARLATRSAEETGASYIVFGKASGFAPVLELSSLDGTNGFEIDGEAKGDRLGYAVAPAKDINGDGYDDFLVAAPAADPSGSGSGAVYLTFDKASGFAATLNLSASDATVGFQINGIAAGDGFGSSVAAGDFNADGFGDLIIGADGADPHGLDSGASYVIYGSADVASRYSNPSTVTVTGGQYELVEGTSNVAVLTGGAFGDEMPGIDEAPGLPPLHIFLATNYVGLGEIKKAKAAMAAARRLGPEFVDRHLAGELYGVRRERHRTFARIAAGLEDPSAAEALR